MPTASLRFQITIETFQMRYCMMFYLKGHQNRQVFFLLKLFSVLKVFFQSQERNSSFIVLFSSFIMRRWNIYFLLLRRKNNFLQKRRFWEENLISPNKLPVLSNRSSSHGHFLSYGHLIDPMKGHFDRAKPIHRMLLASWTFDTLYKGLRSFNT